MARKRKTLPEDFEAILQSGDLAAMQAVFDGCELDARGGFAKQVALAFADCPDELARWLVAQGLGVDTPDQYGLSALHARAGHWRGDIAILLELGADPQRDPGSGTPLHRAAQVHNLEAARRLLDHGARIDARNAQGLTPLGSALQQCSNAKLGTMAPMAELLLAAGAKSGAGKPGLLGQLFGGKAQTEADDPALKAMVRKLGETFEFHRAGFNPDSVAAASAGLDRLYALFGVEPVPRRELHAMDAPIRASAAGWQDRHAELWQALVPGKGAAPSVQGEVIRISGRIAHELDGNGGINWDDDYRRMADAWLAHVGSGTALPAAQLAEAVRLVSAIKSKRGNPDRMCELAVAWVDANPQPAALAPPDYRR